VDPADPLSSDPAGVIYWQAPEIRSGPYDPLKVDVFSLGATVWEMAQHEPPFSDVQDVRQIGDQWPALDAADDFSRPFHDFLRLCSMPSASRPDAEDLLHVSTLRISPFDTF
jgi:serine/threonine-protein kinase CLA4